MVKNLGGLITKKADKWELNQAYNIRKLCKEKVNKSNGGRE